MKAPRARSGSGSSDGSTPRLARSRSSSGSMKDLLGPAILARKRSSGRLFAAKAAVGKEFKTAYAWGRNDYGQLCLGHTLRIGEPRAVVFEGAASSAADRVVLDVACGARHSVVLCEGNELFSAGSNDCQQLGISPEDVERNNRRGTPVNPTKVRAVQESRGSVSVAFNSSMLHVCVVVFRCDSPTLT